MGRHLCATIATRRDDSGQGVFAAFFSQMGGDFFYIIIN
jgi:hypothetical protein